MPVDSAAHAHARAPDMQLQAEDIDVMGSVDQQIVADNVQNIHRGVDIEGSLRIAAAAVYGAQHHHRHGEDAEYGGDEQIAAGFIKIALVSAHPHRDLLMQ